MNFTHSIYFQIRISSSFVIPFPSLPCNFLSVFIHNFFVAFSFPWCTDRKIPHKNKLFQSCNSSEFHHQGRNVIKSNEVFHVYLVFIQFHFGWGYAKMYREMITTSLPLVCFASRKRTPVKHQITPIQQGTEFWCLFTPVWTIPTEFTLLNTN